jgi:putative ABC transport system permease protein
MKRRWFFVFFRKSISQRIGRIIIASIAVTFAVSVVTSMIGVTTGIQEKLGSELRTYGANVIVSPQENDYLDYRVVQEISVLSDVQEAKGQIYGRASYKKQLFEIIGLDLKSLNDIGWRIYGSLPENEGELLVGVNLKDALTIQRYQSISLRGQDSSSDFTVSGFIERGGTEDTSFIMSIPDVWKITGVKGKLSAVLVRGKPGNLDRIVKTIKDTVQKVEVKTFRQVAFAEESLLKKIQLLMLLVTIVVLVATAISVSSTIGANVLERREEMGLMKAMGATRSEISAFYRAESLLIGLVGGFFGFFLGYVFAQVIAQGAFDSYIAIPFSLSIASLFLGVVISLLASYIPVRDALRYSPAVILRGE